MLGRIWAIALNTFREAVRIKVLYGVLVVVFGANFLAIVLGAMSYHEDTRVAQDIGLAGMSIFGSLTAILLGLFLLYNEVQRRTVHAIVSKPIERWEFVVGKWLGMALVLSVLVGLFALAMVLMLVFQGAGFSGALAKATLLAWVEVLTVAAIAIFFSAFSTPFLAGIFSLAMWVIGRVTPEIQDAMHAASTCRPSNASVSVTHQPVGTDSRTRSARHRSGSRCWKKPACSRAASAARPTTASATA